MQTLVVSTIFDDLAAPPAPATLDATGIHVDQLEQLIVKTLFGGEITGLALADRLRLPYPVIEPIVERLRSERLVEVRGATGSGSGAYRYVLSDAGRSRAHQYLDGNGYVGAAPVSLANYVAYLKALDETRGYIDGERLRAGFAHLVIGDGVLEQLGPAINANKAVFLYGAPGNGKTVIGEGIGRAMGGDMYIPYALDIDGSIVRLYDPATHESLEAEDPHPLCLIASASHDRRWVKIRRPVVMAGGELTLDMLDLTFNPIAKYYEAPIQLKANGGVFLVDDFGRQRMRPEDLLNRWIVPLESRSDYLTLHTGKKFQVPFHALVVFATNLDPAQLADEAFLRRIPYKIHIGDPTIEEFTRIFELNCRRRNLTFHKVMVAYIHRRYYGARPLRACHPRDLLEHITALCRYRGAAPTVSRELIDRACTSYFVQHEGHDTGEGRERRVW